MRTDVLIIGGGIAGCATAYYLAREGVEVTLVERNDINTGASGSNAGSIHAQISHSSFKKFGENWARNFGPTIPLMIESINIWRGLDRELDTELEFSMEGGIIVAENEKQMREIERKAQIERAYGLTAEILTQDDLHRIAPYVSRRMIGGAFYSTEGKANPLKVTPAFSRIAIGHGARVLGRTEVTALSTTERGYLATTGRGPIHARRVIDCGGAEAASVAKMLGLTLPIDGHPIQVNVTEPIEPFIPHLIYSAGDRLTLKQAVNGTLLIGGGWPARPSSVAGRLAVDLASLRGNLRAAQTVVPQVGSARLLRTWAANVNVTADSKPFLGEAPGLPGFFMNVFPAMGFTGGPISARVTADLVLGRKPCVDLKPFCVLRHSLA